MFEIIEMIIEADDCVNAENSRFSRYVFSEHFSHRSKKQIFPRDFIADR